MIRAFSLILCLLSTPSLAAQISGHIYVKDAHPNELRAGYVGKSTSGEVITCLAGLTTSGIDTSVWCDTYKPRRTLVDWKVDKGATYKHVELPPGVYMVYIRWGDTYFDWKTVEVKSNNTDLNVNFSVNSAKTGSIRVTIPNTGQLYSIRLTPLKDDRTSTLPGANVALYVGAEIDTKGDTETIRGLCEGWYQLEIRIAERQGSDEEGYFTVYKDIGSWAIEVKSGMMQEYKIPVDQQN